MAACFLGPFADNDGFIQELLYDFFRDHVEWRRGLHPHGDGPVPAPRAGSPKYRQLQKRMFEELSALSHALKDSVPFHSPRYIGHMSSDLLLPGLLAQMLTLPYDPNNINTDSGAVTMRMEMEVGLQLARMLGWPHDVRQPGCAFGHLTSGGTTANYQALRLAMSLKAWPVALRAAKVPEIPLPVDDDAAFNCDPAAGIALFQQWQAWIAALPPADRLRWRARVGQQQVETLGLNEFFARHPTLRVPQVLASSTVHYSWNKGMKLVGLGKAQLRLLHTQGMRLDIEALDEALRDCARTRQPVLMVVAVLGSTEYGSIDPVEAICDARDRSTRAGLGFGVHVDAAWGGYLASVFRHESGALRSLQEMRAEYRDFPQSYVYRAFEGLARADSATVDPHKLGYQACGAGAFVCRDNRAMPLLAEQADYVFAGDPAAGYLGQYARVGQFTPEGSRPGAMAAAAYVSQRVLPLDHAHFGVLARRTILAAEFFTRQATDFAERVRDVAEVLVPCEPDSNLVCLALNPQGNRCIDAASRFVQRLHDRLRPDPAGKGRCPAFLASSTSLREQAVGRRDMQRILRQLGLDGGEAGSVGSLSILRHSLMNPFLLHADAAGEVGNPITQYFVHLEALVRELAAGRR